MMSIAMISLFASVMLVVLFRLFLLLLLLAVSLVVLEFENGSQEEEFLLFSMS